MRLTSTQSTALLKRLASISFLFALCFSVAAQNGCEDDAGNIYGPYEELVVSDDPCENFTCIPSAFSFVWVSNGLQTMEVPCHAWPTGAYVLEVRTAEGVMRSRVLVQH